MGINRVVDFFFSYFRKKKLKFKMQQLLHMLRMAFKVNFLLINFTRETFFLSNKWNFFDIAFSLSYLTCVRLGKVVRRDYIVILHRSLFEVKILKDVGKSKRDEK